jgi:plastocyanin
VNALDSRYLHTTDCFTYRFADEGTFHYGVSPVPVPIMTSADGDDGLAGAEHAHALVVRVLPAHRPSPRQHHVTVGREGGRLIARPRWLEIHAGDLVTWSGDGSAPLGFAIRGGIGETTVDSAAMTDGCVFTHAFGLPGEFGWRDANGSDLRGTVRVTPLVMEGASAIDLRQQWQNALGQGTVVSIVGDRAEPAEVEVLVGQTVAWTVQQAPGVSITDVTLLGGDR